MVSLLACSQGEQNMEDVIPLAPADTGVEAGSEGGQRGFSVDDLTGRVDFQTDVVYFKYDDTTITRVGMSQLDALAQYMKTNRGSKLNIEGHADNRGSVEYNLALGQRRSESVKNYLETVGVEETRLHTISYGEEKPQEIGEGEDVWTKNRRVDFTFVNYK